MDLDTFNNIIKNIGQAFESGKVRAKDCICNGECMCHYIYLAGVPCPEDCKNYAHVFDGCHRCDCGKEKS